MKDIDPDDWAPLRGVWVTFVTAHPELGYVPSDHAYGRFARTHFLAMHERGALVRLRNGRYLAHKDRFARAAFSVLIKEVTS